MADEVVMEFVKRFPTGVEVRAEARLATDASPFTVLFGPSGSGKTTILRCLAGLERPDEGFIRFGDETWFDAARRVFVPPHHRPIGYLFQDYALFPHLTAAGNVAYGLGDVPGPERRSRVAEMVKLLGLAQLEDRYPNQLSGGQQQRVALARALVRRPRLLLLDEPLSALDAPSREHLRRDLHALLSKLAVPTVLVTHDRTDTLAFGDRVVVLDGGRVLQNGSVDDVFNRPASTAVARIVGVETVQPGKILKIADGLATVAVGQASLVALASAGHEGKVYICIRGEDVILDKGDSTMSSARNRLPSRVVALSPEGAMIRITLDCGFRLIALTTKQACQELALREGEIVTALVKAPAVHLVPRD